MKYSFKYESWLTRIFNNSCQSALAINGQVYISIQKKNLIAVFLMLRDHQNAQYKILSDIISIDYPSKSKRFELVYHALSTRFSARVFVRLKLSQPGLVSSMTHIFQGAGWYEREIFDLFGVVFKDHPDLRRILTDYGFDGHPLRKDFPLIGFTEVRFDYLKKRVICEPLEVLQDFRGFSGVAKKNWGYKKIVNKFFAVLKIKLVGC